MRRREGRGEGKEEEKGRLRDNDEKGVSGEKKDKEKGGMRRREG